MIYLAVFSFSILSAALAQVADSKEMKYYPALLSIIAVFLLSLLGGLRNETIGTDILYYVKGNFDAALWIKSFPKYFTAIYAKEPLYLVVVYLIAKLFGNFQVLLFFFQTMTIGCVYFAAWKSKKYVSPWFVLLLYCAMYYNDSFNMVRQHLAMAIVLLGSVYLVEENNKYCLICFFIAFLFHKTAILSLVLVPIYYYLKRTKSIFYFKKRKPSLYGKKMRELTITITALVGILGIKIWCQLFIQIGILSSRYLYYFTDDNISGHYLDTLLYSFEICVLVFYSKYFKNNMYNYRFYRTIAFLNVILLQLTLFMSYGHRLSLYFGIINLLTIAQIPQSFHKKSNRIIVYSFITLIAIVYWVKIYYIGHVSDTIPYLFFYQ